METVKKPVFFLDYNQKNITAWITPYCLQVQYVDHLHEKSDSLEIQVEDREGKWKNEWFPTKGDSICLSIGYDGEPLLPCGNFQIDELEFSGPPDVVTLRALGAGVGKAIRTKSSRAFEKRSLRDIAGAIASEHGLSVVGNCPYVALERMTQNRETDLGFLRRIAHQHGVVFSVRGDQLIFHDFEELEQRKAAYLLDRKFTKAFSLRTKSQSVYRDSHASYFDPETKQVIESTATSQGKRAGDTLRIRRRAENRSHADRQAKAGLKFSNGWETEGSLTVIGNPKLVAGSNIELAEDFGTFKGLYQVVNSRHTLDRSSGYTTEIEVRRV